MPHLIATAHQVGHVGGDVVHPSGDKLLRVAVQEGRPARAVRHVEVVHVDALVGDIVQQLPRLPPVVDAVEVCCGQYTGSFRLSEFEDLPVHRKAVVWCETGATEASQVRACVSCWRA